ncbi:MAG: O-antigen ligase family protein [Pseudomonadota bacterium]
MPTTPYRRPHFPGGIARRGALQPGRGHVADEIMVILTLIVMPIDLPAMQVIRAPFTILLFAYGAVHWRSLLPTIREGWAFFLLPAFCFLSALWAAKTGPAVWHGALLGMTLGIAALIATRLDARQVAVAILVSQGGLAVVSILNLSLTWVGDASGGYASLGVFGHKNVLGQRMLFLSVAALTILLSPGYRQVWRLAALGLLPIGLFLIARSMAATAMILLAGAIPLCLALALLWRPAGQVRGLRPALFWGGLALGTLGVLLVTNLAQVDVVGEGLALFGKDRSLTGRTDIWLAAQSVVAQNPLLGVGAGNFWQADSYGAARIAALFGRDASAFYFHNTYYEILVHLGAVGLILAIWVYGKAVLLIGRNWWRTQSVADPFYIVMVVVILLRTLTESVLFEPFILDMLFFWVVAFSAIPFNALFNEEAVAATRQPFRKN